MQVYMKNIPYSFTHHHLVGELADVLHRAPYTIPPAAKVNFHVHLYRDKRGHQKHCGQGTLTLPTNDIGVQFLQDYGDPSPSFSIHLGGRRIRFSASNQAARPEVLESITRCPYLDPRMIEERERRDTQLAQSDITIETIQFGWECRDSFFSIEWEETFPTGCSLHFNGERREIRIEIRQGFSAVIIVIRVSHIITLSSHTYLGNHPVIFLLLEWPPAFEFEVIPSQRRQRLSALPFSNHRRIAPYGCLAIRLICSSRNDLREFEELASLVQLHDISHEEYLIDRRNLFSGNTINQLADWLQSLDWCVAFQVEAMVRSWAVDIKEMISLVPLIEEMIGQKGGPYTGELLRFFTPKAKELWWDPHDPSQTSTLDDLIKTHFIQTAKEFESFYAKSSPIEPTDGSLFQAYHATVTPTTMYLEGPFLERSNRVIRKYDHAHNESFLRVSFLEEDHLQYRFDREIDGQAFIRSHVGDCLLEGLEVGGRYFQFLAYSQSALKEHSVWFIKPFQDPIHGYMDAARIIRDLGSFRDLPFDPRLMYCPARYGARISQAFTATDLSVSIPDIEEVIYLSDIKTPNGEYCFTDGVGTISLELAIEIQNELRSRRRRGHRHRNHPPAIQVRFMGSKGMLSVDHTLQGSAICLRPSMIKFEAPDSLQIEIARAFDRPAPYYLNRPLIMLLEGLGVPFEIFKELQDRAVEEAWKSTESIFQAAKMFENHGLGSSYRLPSILLHLDKLGIDNIYDNKFYKKMLEYAIHHVLRVLKNHARIPVPNAWTLVGVADVHKYLMEGEVFICIQPLFGKRIYLQGPVLISRSPTIHPGDVQVAFAIGSPPEGSCFSREPLPNTVVFSVLGSRPLPSCLGGGDLDGDVYNIIPLNKYPMFKPPNTYKPASYTPVPRKELNRLSTMADVAEFVMEYINSDVVGIIATNWLIIADQSPDGIHDEDCLKLSQLHSDAVDYPKSGNPVALERIPKLRARERPDWNAPETVNPDSGRYYESQRAIGRLFRDIDLPAVPHPTTARHGRRQRRERPDLASVLSRLNVDDPDFDPVQNAIESHVSRYIDIGFTINHPDEEHLTAMFQRYVAELTTACSACSLSQFKSGPLSEEEAIIGTIAQKSSQPKRRKDMMSKLREYTDTLVRGIREEISGDEDVGLERALERGWLAWQLAITNRAKFGAESFGWIALGSIFETIETIKEIDELEQLQAS